MRESKTEVAVGAAVVAVAATFLVYVMQTTGLAATGSGKYDLTAAFRSAEGISLGTDVRMSGVKVGSVTGLTLNPETFRADTTLTLNDGIPVPNDSTAVISSEGLLGGNFVEIMPGGSLDNYLPDEAILDTQGSVSIISLLLKFVSGGEAE